MLVSSLSNQLPYFAVPDCKAWHVHAQGAPQFLGMLVTFWECCIYILGMLHFGNVTFWECYNILSAGYVLVGMYLYLLILLAVVLFWLQPPRLLGIECCECSRRGDISHSACSYTLSVVLVSRYGPACRVCDPSL